MCNTTTARTPRRRNGDEGNWTERRRIEEHTKPPPPQGKKGRLRRTPRPAPRRARAGSAWVLLLLHSSCSSPRRHGTRLFRPPAAAAAAPRASESSSGHRSAAWQRSRALPRRSAVLEERMCGARRARAVLSPDHCAGSMPPTDRLGVPTRRVPNRPRYESSSFSFFAFLSLCRLATVRVLTAVLECANEVRAVFFIVVAPVRTAAAHQRVRGDRLSGVTDHRFRVAPKHRYARGVDETGGSASKRPFHAPARRVIDGKSRPQLDSSSAGESGTDASMVKTGAHEDDDATPLATFQQR